MASLRHNRSALVIVNPRRVRPLWLRLIMWGLLCCCFWFVSAVVVMTGLYFYVVDDLPELPAFEQIAYPGTTRVYSQTGIVVGEFATERRDLLAPADLPEQIVKAFLAAEDDGFFEHGGFEPLGMLRAIYKNLEPGGYLQGASTISQQVAKTFVGWERSLLRKYKEGVITVRMENKYTKPQILSLYMNHLNMGHGSHGVQAAARNYFGKNARDLDLAEAAALAGLPQGPELYDLVDNPKLARWRRDWVLSRMHDEGFISLDERRAAEATPIRAASIVSHFKNRAPWYVEEVRRFLQTRYGTAGLYQSGLIVQTALDLDMQQAAQRAVADGVLKVDRRQGYRGPLTHLASTAARKTFVERLEKLAKGSGPEVGQVVLALVAWVEQKKVGLDAGGVQGELPLSGMRWARKPNPTVHVNSAAARVKDARKVLRVGDVIYARRMAYEGQGLRFELHQPPDVQAALVSMEPGLGYVRALIGGRDFSASEFNRARQACRQPGSTFKPLYYSLAFEEYGFSPATTLLDSPVVYRDADAGGSWKPQNPSRDFKGLVTVHTALVNSMALPSIKVMEKIGLQAAMAWAAKLGITSKLREELGLALGSSCVTLWDLTSAYAVFNQGGHKPRLGLVRKVTDRWGRVLLDHSSHRDPWQSWDSKFDRAYDGLVSPRPQLMSPESAYMTTHLLQGVASRGTGARSRALGKPVAGKTGTTNDSADTWFMGFTHDLLTGVWVGNDKPSQPLSRGEDGLRTALPIWLASMQAVLKNRPQGPFDVPAGITFARMDPATGKLARPDTPGAVLEAFRRGELPPAADTESGPTDGRDLFDPGML
jgi:penicillin-binding protein 1A